MTTLVAGVIVAGVGSNANPHALASHTDVALSAPTDGDVIRYVDSTGKWTKTSPLTLPVPSHNHDGVYVVPSDLTPLAPKANPTLTGTVTVAGTTPKVVFNETDGTYSTWINDIRIDSGALLFKMDSEDVRKIEARYVDYQALSLGLPALNVTADHTAANPGCVRYIDATNNDVVVSLQTVANYYRTVTRQTGVVLFFVREDASANTVTIAANGSDTIDGAASITLDYQKSFAIIQATSDGWRIIARSESSATDTGWEDMQWYSTKVSDSRTNWGTTGMTQFKARKMGDVIRLRGGMQVNTTINAAENVCQLPAGMIPSVPCLIIGKSYNGSAASIRICTVKTDGYIAMSSGQSAPAGYTFYLDSISFTTS